jgi:3,4-dihydroxy 2-butanone 4-phosphate synthase/GTP cyclohydrolase II
MTGLREHGVDVTERIPLITTPSADNLHYLWTKQTRMGHHTAVSTPNES